MENYESCHVDWFDNCNQKWNYINSNWNYLMTNKMASQSMFYDITFTCVKHENRIIYLVTPFRPFSKFNFPVQYLSICSVSFMVRFICRVLYSTHTYAIIVTKNEISVYAVNNIFQFIIWKRHILRCAQICNIFVFYYNSILMQKKYVKFISTVSRVFVIELGIIQENLLILIICIIVE